MSTFDRRPRLRWAVPAAATVLIVGGALVGGAGASADSGLAPQTAEQLLVDLQSPQAASLTGTVEVRADLGLPALPAGMGSATDLTALISGTHTLRVWADGADRSRVALLGPAEEYDVIRNGSDVWIWSSAEKTATHVALPDEGPTAAAPQMDVPSTPQEAAQRALAAVDATTEVTTSGVGEVAGRPVYELILTPRQSDTLVARVVVAMDAQTHVPLRVQVFSTEISDPAFEVGFTSVDFGAPDPAVFSFTPPPGATVTEHAGLTGPAGRDADGGAPPAHDGVADPVVVGSGWSEVIVGTVPPDALGDGSTDPGADDPGAQALALLRALPRTSGSWGSGSVLEGTLFTAILTDDGRFAIGAVAPEVLDAALATG